MNVKLTSLVALLFFAGFVALSDRRGVPDLTHVRVQVLAATPEYRLIRHSLGDTKVPLTPKRIVSLGGVFTESLLAMGVKPVGVQSYFASGGAGTVDPHLATQLKGVPTVSNSGDVNLEAVADVKPDLIILSGNENSLWYHYLSGIAPTVAIASYGMPPNREIDALLNVGDILGRPDLAQKALGQYFQKAAEAKKTLAKTIGSKPVVYFKLWNGRCQSRPLIYGALLFDRLGLTPDPTVLERPEPVTWDTISLERLTRLHADYMFVSVDRNSAAYWHDLINSGYCRQIPAVRHNHVFSVTPSAWQGQGIFACGIMIDETVNAALGKMKSIVDDAATVKTNISFRPFGVPNVGVRRSRKSR